MCVLSIHLKKSNYLEAGAQRELATKLIHCQFIPWLDNHSDSGLLGCWANPFLLQLFIKRAGKHEIHFWIKCFCSSPWWYIGAFWSIEREPGLFLLHFTCFVLFCFVLYPTFERTCFYSHGRDCKNQIIKSILDFHNRICLKATVQFHLMKYLDF